MSSSNFMSYEEFDPISAKLLPAGLKLQVSRKTLSQIALEKFNEMNPQNKVDALTPDNAKILRAALLKDS